MQPATTPCAPRPQRRDDPEVRGARLRGHDSTHQFPIDDIVHERAVRLVGNERRDTALVEARAVERQLHRVPRAEKRDGIEAGGQHRVGGCVADVEQRTLTAASTRAATTCMVLVAITSSSAPAASRVRALRPKPLAERVPVRRAPAAPRSAPKSSRARRHRPSGPRRAAPGPPRSSRVRIRPTTPNSSRRESRPLHGRYSPMRGALLGDGGGVRLEVPHRVVEQLVEGDRRRPRSGWQMRSEESVGQVRRGLRASVRVGPRAAAVSSSGSRLVSQALEVVDRSTPTMSGRSVAIARLIRSHMNWSESTMWQTTSSDDIFPAIGLACAGRRGRVRRSRRAVPLGPRGSGASRSPGESGGSQCARATGEAGRVRHREVLSGRAVGPATSLAHAVPQHGQTSPAAARLGSPR